MRRRWKKIRHRIEWLTLVGATRIIPLLSRKACHQFAQFTGALAAQLDRHGRRVALANLAVVFGDTLSAGERRKIVRESFQHFARTMLDLFWSPRLTRDNFSKYVEFENLEPWLAEIRPGDPFILGCYHYSNFEWLSLTGGFLGYPSAIIAQEFKNPLLDSLFKDLREQSGHEMVSREGAIIRLYKALRRKKGVAILVDLTIPPKTPTVAIDCFGLKTSVTFAHAWLHQRSGAPIVMAHCEPLPEGRYRMVFHPKLELKPGASLQEITQSCWDQFEPYVKQNPAPWLWMYKHWRYRPEAA
ncbi:MAG: lysophospholipid acyltransferase family protein, partial [Chthoniobacterales bacterium]